MIPGPRSHSAFLFSFWPWLSVDLVIHGRAQSLFCLPWSCENLGWLSRYKRKRAKSLKGSIFNYAMVHAFLAVHRTSVCWFAPTALCYVVEEPILVSATYFVTKSVYYVWIILIINQQAIKRNWTLPPSVVWCTVQRHGFSSRIQVAMYSLNISLLDTHAPFHEEVVSPRTNRLFVSRPATMPSFPPGAVDGCQMCG